MNLLKDQNITDKKQIVQDLDKYKTLSLQFETEKNEILTSYDRDKILWQGKF